VCFPIESHFNGRRFSRQFSLCCSWGQFLGAASSLNVFITPNEWKLRLDPVCSCCCCCWCYYCCCSLIFSSEKAI